VPPAWRERRQAEQRTRSALIVVAIVSAAYGVYASNPLLVREVRVETDGTLPLSLIRRHTEGLQGQHWLVARTKPVERRLERVPAISRAHVTKWPVGEVTVRVEERTPVAAVPTPKGRLLVDAEGVVFTGPKPPAMLPLLVSRQFAEVRLGSRLPEREFVSVSTCLRTARRLGMGEPRKLIVDEGGAVTLFAEGPCRMRLGRLDLERKLTLAKCAMDSLRRQGKPVRSLDLRAIEAPTWSPRLS